MTPTRRHALLWIPALALALAGCRSSTPTPPPPLTKKAPPKAEPEPKKSPFVKPEHVRGIYLTAWSAGSTRKMDRVFAMLERTELNAIVIDVRDAGNNYWKMGIPLSDDSGATKVAILKPEKLMKRLLEKNVYPIARIACFRDNFVPRKHPGMAVKHANGGVWKDRAGYTWLDPYNKKNWEYIGQIVDFALDQGFPEIQLDYVRFPSEGKAATQVFPAKAAYPDKTAKPEDVVAAFATYIGERVKKRGAAYSADIFGIISIGKVDQGIGQELEKIAGPFDLVCPMVYPSHFAKGEYGVKDPSNSPYAIVSKSLADYKRRLPDKPIRPWLQDFFGYGASQIQGQIKAAKELGYEEYLLWNAQNRYVEAAVVDNSKLVKKPVGKPVPVQTTGDAKPK